MSLTLVSPAPLGATGELLAATPWAPAFRKMAAKLGATNARALARLQIAAGPSWGALDKGGRLVAAAGLMPHGDALEIWFDCRPDIGRRIAGVAKLAQLTLAGIKQSRVVTIRARVAEGWAPGQRLARLMRMRFTGLDATGFEVWELS